MNMTFQHKMAKFAWSVVVTSSLFACNLDEELTSVYNADNAYVTEQNAQEGVNGIYRYLKGGTHPATFYLNDVSTDAAYKAGLDYEIMNDNNLSGNVDVARAYNGNFQMIGCANSAIDNITPMAASLRVPPIKRSFWAKPTLCGHLPTINSPTLFIASR